jgi:diguanylate cyclase (GGDEF)-like protein
MAPRYRSFLRYFLRPSIQTERDLAFFVVGISALCLTAAVAVDVVNQCLFFVSWTASWRSWGITALLAVALAVPISHVVGKSYLDLYRAKLEVDELSRTDPLTGLPNRRAFLEAADAPSPGAMVLVILDIDRFKRVNDTGGHIVGDAVLSAVAQMMAADLGTLGPIGRIGGEEFAFLCFGESNGGLAPALFAFRDRVAATPILTGGGAVRVTISAGVALRCQGENLAQLYRNADEALYAAKASGRNRVCFTRAFRDAYGEVRDDGIPSSQTDVA